MSLSTAAKLYLTWQVFDAVNRQPVRFAHLPDSVPGLVAWPDFRHAVMADSRFLVAGDAIDIATAGIHPSSPVDQIITATLDRARLPMRDHDLNRVVRRLRPEFPRGDDPVASALQSADLFRPRNGHVARRKWLHDARAIALPADLPGTPLDVAAAYLELNGGRVLAVSLAAALAERFGISMPQAYGVAVHEQFLALPDGTVCLYLPVEDEITDAVEVLEQEAAGWPSEIFIPSAPSEEQDSYPLPPHIAADVAHTCNRTRRPVSTEHVLTELLGLSPDDDHYLTAFWAVNRLLGMSADLLTVGEYLWYTTAAVPGEVFRTILASPAKEGSPEVVQRTVTGFGPVGRILEAGPPTFATLVISPEEIAAGAVRSHRLAPLFPDTPHVQVLQWNGVQAWYNAETSTVVGLAQWMRTAGLQPGDSVLIRRTASGCDAEVRPGNRPAARSGGGEEYKAPAAPKRTKSLLLAVTEVLTRAGGTLAQAELLALLQAEDPWVDWSDVKPLLERYPNLGIAGDLCFMVTLAGPHTGGGAVQVEILSLLDRLSDSRPELRDHPVILHLVRHAAEFPRVSASREAVLLPQAQAALQAGHPDHDKLEIISELLGAHMRMVVGQILQRDDLEELLPFLDDCFQVGCRGVLKAIEKFDRNRSSRLAHVAGLYIRGHVDRLKIEFARPLRFPGHFAERMDKVHRRRQRRDTLGVDPEAEAWYDRKFVGSGEWEEAYEDGNIRAEPLTGAEVEDPFESAARADLRAVIDELLDTITPREAKVIRLRVGLDDDRERTLEEIGHVFGVTRERIRQIEAKALRRLRHPSRLRRLCEEY